MELVFHGSSVRRVEPGTSRLLELIQTHAYIAILMINALSGMARIQQRNTKVTWNAPKDGLLRRTRSPSKEAG